MLNAFEITNLTKTYRGFSLDRLNLTLPSGCIMGLVGENGAGKSTTIKLMLDMISRDEGEIKILGRDNREDIVNLKEDIGVVPDEIGLSGALTAKRVGRIMSYTFKNWDADVYNNYLQKLGVPENKKFKELSRGMKMKLGIAVALSHHPKLLLLDEPTSGLDPVVRDEVVDMLMDFTRDDNHSILISSHIVSDLEKLCDYIAFLHKGKLLLCEEKDALKDEYRMINCAADELRKIPESAIIGKKMTPYGVEAIVRRDRLPNGMASELIDIEKLFIFMVKGEQNEGFTA